MLDIENSLVLVIDIQERLVASLDKDVIVTRVGKLVDAANILGIPVIASEQYPKGLGQTIVDIRQAAGEQAQYFAKQEFSCWKNETIKKRLQTLGKKQVIIAGVETHICVLQTALELKEEGFEVFVVADSCSSRKNLQHVYALQRLAHCNIEVVTYEMIVFEWLEKIRACEGALSISQIMFSCLAFKELGFVKISFYPVFMFEVNQNPPKRELSSSTFMNKLAIRR